MNITTYSSANPQKTVNYTRTEGVYTTSYKVNAGEDEPIGHLFLLQNHTNDGDATDACLVFVRLGYSGNHITVQKIIGSDMPLTYSSFEVSANGYLQIKCGNFTQLRIWDIC